MSLLKIPANSSCRPTPLALQLGSYSSYRCQHAPCPTRNRSTPCQPLEQSRSRISIGIAAAPAGRSEHATAAAADQAPAPEPGSHITAAWTLLQDFTSKQFRGTAGPMLATAAQRSKLKEALLLVYSCPYPELGWTSASDTGLLLGFMASDARLAVRALRDWCQALCVPFVQPGSTSSSSSSSSTSNAPPAVAAAAGSHESGASAISSSSEGSNSGSRASSASSLAGMQGPAYIKYNSKTGQCYASPFRGNDRGVLVQLGQVQLGHFPLGMFDEEMRNPAPS